MRRVTFLAQRAHVQLQRIYLWSKDPSFRWRDLDYPYFRRCFNLLWRSNTALLLLQELRFGSQSTALLAVNSVGNSNVVGYEHLPELIGILIHNLAILSIWWVQVSRKVLQLNKIVRGVTSAGIFFGVVATFFQWGLFANCQLAQIRVSESIVITRWLTWTLLAALHWSLQATLVEFRLAPVILFSRRAKTKVGQLLLLRRTRLLLLLTFCLLLSSHSQSINIEN